MLEVII